MRKAALIKICIQLEYTISFLFAAEGSEIKIDNVFLYRIFGKMDVPEQ